MSFLGFLLDVRNPGTGGKDDGSLLLLLLSDAKTVNRDHVSDGGGGEVTWLTPSLKSIMGRNADTCTDTIFPNNRTNKTANLPG